MLSKQDTEQIFTNWEEMIMEQPRKKKKAGAPLSGGRCPFIFSGKPKRTCENKTGGGHYRGAEEQRDL